MRVLLLLLITAIPFAIYFAITPIQHFCKNPKKYLHPLRIPENNAKYQILSLCLSALGVIAVICLFIAPSQIKKSEQKNDQALLKSGRYLNMQASTNLGDSFKASDLNDHLLKRPINLKRSTIVKRPLNTSNSYLISYAPVDVEINQIGLAKNTPVYEYDMQNKLLISVDGAFVSKSKPTYTTTRLQKVSLAHLQDAYYLNNDSTYFVHNHNLIFTQNNKNDLYDFEYGSGNWCPDLTQDTDNSGTNGYTNNLKYFDPVEDGSKPQYVASDSQYHSFPYNELLHDSALRKVHLNDYDYRTLLKHEWHPASFTTNLSGKLHPVIYYESGNFAYYLPLTKLGKNYYYEIDPVSKSLVFNKRARNSGKDSAYYRIRHHNPLNIYGPDGHSNDTNSAVSQYRYYVKACDVTAINGHGLTVYNAPLEISAQLKRTLFDKLLMRQPQISVEDQNKYFTQIEDPYNYRLNYSYFGNSSVENCFANVHDPLSSSHISANNTTVSIPTGRILDEAKYAQIIKNNTNISHNLYQVMTALNKTIQKDEKSTNSDSKGAQKKQVQMFNQILQKQKALADVAQPKYANTTLKGEQPDIQHLLSLSFGYTNLDPCPNDPWKRNEAGREPYLKFDTLFSPTAKHNIQPEYPIDKVVYVQSIVRNSIKGRHNEFYLLAQGDERCGNTIRRWTYPIMPNKYVHVSDIVAHKQIKTHYDNFLDTSIFAYHMLDLDRYNHYDNAFRFIPDYTTPHNVYQTSGQPGSRTTEEKIYGTFLPPIDTAEDNLKLEK